MATVTLTREHRDAIHDQIQSVVGSAGDIHFYFERADADANDREWLRTIAWRLTVCVRLLDQLGWQEHGNGDSYQLTVDADIARFMADLEHTSRGALDDNRRDLLAPRQAYACYEMTDEEWEQHRVDMRRLVDIDLDSIDAARRVQSAFREAV
jgi:hypothetical protein